MAKYYSDKNPYDGNERYEEVHAISDRPNARGMYPRAQMTVRHSKAREHANFKQLEDNTDLTRSRAHQQVYDETGYDRGEVTRELGDSYHMAVSAARQLNEYRDNSTDPTAQEFAKHYRRYAGINYAQNIRDIKRGTSQFFTPQPATTEIRGAFAHTSMKAHIPVMGAYFHQKYGELTASEDLSEHSSRMTEHAEKLGLPVKRSEDNPDLDVTNSYDFNNSDMVASATPFSTSSTTRIPDETMKSAKQHYKALRGIGKSTPKPLSTQFTQPQLPGMEDK
jgi:hypothetical protein